MMPVRVRERGRELWPIDAIMRRVFGDGGSEPLATMAWGGYGVDIWEDNDHLYVEAEAPGYTKDQLDVTLENGVLTIHGRRGDPKREGTMHLSEVRFGEFTRSFSLPVRVDEGAVNASLKDGLLRITLNKREEAKARRIDVTAG